MFKRFFFDLLELLLIFIFVFLPIRIFIFEPFVVIGESMEPNLHNSDYIIVCKICTRLKNPERFEIIVFVPPVDDKKYYVKRVIGLPNEKIVIKNNQIFVFNKDYPNGFKLNEPYLIGENFYMEDTEINLRDDEYFVLGDNRNESFDSRKWDKSLKKENIIGKVIFRLSFLGKFISILKPEI